MAYKDKLKEFAVILYNEAGVFQNLLTSIVLSAGSAIIGKVGIDQTTPGTTNAIVITNAAANANAKLAGDQDAYSSGNTALIALAELMGFNGTTWDRLRTAAASGGGLGALFTALRAKVTNSGDTELLSDNAGALRVSMYGKQIAAGDKPVLVDGDGLTQAIAVYTVGGVDGYANGNLTLAQVGLNIGRMQQVATAIFNGTTWDRTRSIAASGAGLGVQQVGTLGELITLAASAARTTGANGTAVTGLGWRNRYIILIDVTALGSLAGDTLDVYVDVSLDGTTWLNAVHGTQRLGNGAAAMEYAVLDPSAPGTATINVTADAAVSTVRPSMFGPQMRARWAITNGGGTHSFTFSVVAYAI